MIDGFDLVDMFSEAPRRNDAGAQRCEASRRIDQRLQRRTPNLDVALAKVAQVAQSQEASTLPLVAAAPCPSARDR